jgi:hypothetical protein
MTEGYETLTKTSDKIQKEIIINTIKMLVARQLVKNDNSAILNKEGKFVEIKLDKHLTDDDPAFNGSKIYLKILRMSIDNATNMKMINDFITKFANFHKIIVLDNYTSKI